MINLHKMIEGERNQLFEACGKYSRTIEVFKGIDLCFECKQKKECLIFDSSDGEYSKIFFCLECLKRFGDGFVSNSTYNTNDLSDEDCLR